MDLTILKLDSMQKVQYNHQELYRIKMEELEKQRLSQPIQEVSYWNPPNIIGNTMRLKFTDLPTPDKKFLNERYGYLQETKPERFAILNSFVDATEHLHPHYSNTTIMILAEQDDEKLSQLHKLATKKSKNGFLRISDEDIQFYTKLETERLKKLAPIIHAETSNGNFQFSDNDCYRLARMSEEQLEQIQMLNHYGFKSGELFKIIEDKNINKPQLAQQLQKISEIFQDSLEETSIYKVTNHDGYILTTSSTNMIANANEYKKIQILVDKNMEPIACSSKPSKLFLPSAKAELQYNINLKEISDKINSQLNIVKPEEIRNIATELKKTYPQFEEKEIYQVMQRLTQFASYNSLSEIGKVFNDEHCFNFESTGKINSLFNYLQLKNFMDFNSIEDNKICYILNKPEPQLLNAVLDEYPEDYRFVCLDGFDEGITIFNDRTHLAEKTSSILKKIKTLQAGKDCSVTEALDEILNQKALKHARENNLRYTLIKNEGYATAECIARQMNPNVPMRSDINAMIEAIADSYKSFGTGIATKLELSKYINETVDIYSPQRLVEILKARKTLIDKKVKALGKTPQDIFFVNLQKDKSFNLITSMYAEVNDIPAKQILNVPQKEIDTGFWLHQMCKKHPQKAFVILDDIFGSGDSILEATDYKNMSKLADSNHNLIFSPVCTTKKSHQRLQRMIRNNKRSGKDFIIIEHQQIKSQAKISELNWKQIWQRLIKSRTPKEFKTSLVSSVEEKLTARFLKHGGYQKGLCCTLFPYMAPDNNSKISTIFLQMFTQSIDSLKSRSEDIAEYKFKAQIFSLVRRLRP